MGENFQREADREQIFGELGHLLDSADDDSSYELGTNHSDTSLSSLSSSGDIGNTEETGRGDTLGGSELHLSITQRSLQQVHECIWHLQLV